MAMTTRLYLVRHGATQLTAENKFSGSVGVDLSEPQPGWAVPVGLCLSPTDL